MNFKFTEEQEAFRREVREFLAKAVPEEVKQETAQGGGGNNMGYASRDFQRELGKKGWLGIDWPVEFGGSGRTLVERYLLYEELGYAGAPFVGVASSIVAPMLFLYGTEEQKREYIPRIARGEIEFALGYTEPQAGSDLASLDIRAIEQEDCFIVNGQKMFNTAAHYADYHWLGARTDPAAAKHRGISLFIVDLKSPGITIRPLIAMGGMRTNEVFYDNVRVPKKNLVGEKNRGFYHILQALDFERITAVGDLVRLWENLTKYARETNRDGETLSNNSLIADALTQAATDIEVARLFALRVMWLISKHQAPPAQASMLKVFADELRQRLIGLGMQMMGLYGQLQKGSKYAQLEGNLETMYRAARIITVVAGTSEIQRNIIANVGLGMRSK